MTAIGIDLGTTNSCVGVWQNGKVEILQNDQGNRLTPSVVAFTETERLVGDAAKYQAALNPENTIFNVKRLIGRKFYDEETQKDIKLLPYKVINDNDTPKIEAEFMGEKKVFALEEISSMVLIKLKEIAEAYLGTPVRDAVITVPAYFNDSQKQATIDAGKIAGLNVLRIISEPTAAALAYGIEKKIDSEKNVLIYDLGGGTFDVSILSVKKSSYFKVLSTSGDTHLGGEDIDNLLVDYLAKEFKEQNDVDISDNSKVLARLRKESEQAKRNLSSSFEAKIEIESLHEGIPFQTKITRARFDEICLKLFTRTLETVENALKDAKLEKSDIDDIVLVGGSSRIPKIQALLKDFFDGKNLTMNINADEVVAFGAAIQAANLSEAKNSSLPKLFVIDVAPLSLGIETKGGIMTKIINRNTSLPCKESKSFSTTVDNAETITFSIFEGERLLALDNNLLGKFELTNIPLAPMGVPELVCTFEINEDGILNVTAKEVSSGVSKNIVIQNDRGRLSKREIDRMIADAEQNKMNDEKEKNRIDVRNRLEFFAFKTKQAAEKSDLEESVKADIISRCYEVIKWLDSNFLASEEEHLGLLNELQDYCEPLLGKKTM